MPTSPLPDHIGPYQVLDLLGQGTMSQVYRVSLPLLGHQEYAVKLLRERCKPREVSAFLGECTKVKRLGTHPHLVPLYFAGRDRRLGRYFVAMELVHGLTAAQLLAAAPAHQLPVARAAHIAIQVALGLEHTHQRGILHLDVKPSNILVEEGDLAKLTDFGSAQVQEEIASRIRQSRPGAPAYRAWEQSPAGTQVGLVPDVRSDVYGLAATLYHLLTGQIPQWTADGALRSPRQWRADLPQELEGLLLEALSREPEERPQTMEAFRRALERWDTPQPGGLLSPLPIPGTRLVGRSALLQTLKQRLLTGESLALAALNGLPGVGKTAMAVAIATDPEVQAHFADGILWAGLGKTPDLLAILSAWGAALGLAPEEAARLQHLEAWALALRNRIGERRMLLVLDDAWSLEQALACRVGGPRTAHLLTTRSTELALQFAGDGLTLVPELAGAEGLELLGQLAPLVVADQPEEARAVVQAVGGLPLGLVLLGKHLQLQSHGRQPRRIQAALERLQQRGERLRVALPQAPAEAHPSFPAGTLLSLSASIGLSEATLSHQAQAMLHALAVFPSKPSSFSEGAALAVSAGTVESLDALVDAGLLESIGAGRYSLHQTIVDYARQQGRQTAAEQRLLAWAVDYIEIFQRDYPRLEQELPLLLEALRLPETDAGRPLLIRGSLALGPFLLRRGLYASIEDLYLRAQAAARILGDIPSLVDCLLQVGRIAVRRGVYEQATTSYHEALALARQTDNQRQIGETLLAQGLLLLNQGETVQAYACMEEGLILARQAQDKQLVSQFLGNMGTGALRRGAFAEAERYYQEALPLAQAIQSINGISMALQGLAHTAARRGAYIQAEAYAQEAVALAHREGQRNRLGPLLCMLGGLACEQGHFEQAKAYLLEGLHCAQEIGFQEGICNALVELSEVLVAMEDWAEAERVLEDGLHLARQIGHRESLCALLRAQGQMALQQGQMPQAKAALQEGLALAQAAGYRWHLAGLLRTWGQYLIANEQLEEAEQAFEESLHLAQALANQDQEAAAWYELARLAQQRGQLGLARQHGQESLRLYEAHNRYQQTEVRHWLEQLTSGACPSNCQQ